MDTAKRGTERSSTDGSGRAPTPKPTRRLTDSPYFRDWVRWLWRIMAIAMPIVVAAVVVQWHGTGAGAGRLVGLIAMAVLTTAINVIVWTALGFALAALLDRSGRGRRAGAGDGIGADPAPGATAPPGPTKGDVVGAAVFAVIVLGVLVWQRTGPFDVGEPLLRPELWTFWLPYLIALLFADAVFLAVLYLRGGWTYPAAVLNLVLNLAFAVPVAWLALTDRLLNPAFFVAVADRVSGDVSEWLVRGGEDDATRTALVIAAVVAVVAVIDVIAGFAKARRATV